MVGQPSADDPLAETASKIQATPANPGRCAAMSNNRIHNAARSTIPDHEALVDTLQLVAVVTRADLVVVELHRPPLFVHVTHDPDRGNNEPLIDRAIVQHVIRETRTFDVSPMPSNGSAVLCSPIIGAMNIAIGVLYLERRSEVPFSTPDHVHAATIARLLAWLVTRFEIGNDSNPFDFSQRKVWTESDESAWMRRENSKGEAPLEAIRAF
jgi:hypothetical protein